jgi:hypothetical protein
MNDELATFVLMRTINLQFCNLWINEMKVLHKLDERVIFGLNCDLITLNITIKFTEFFYFSCHFSISSSSLLLGGDPIFFKKISYYFSSMSNDINQILIIFHESMVYARNERRDSWFTFAPVITRFNASGKKDTPIGKILKSLMPCFSPMAVNMHRII